MPRTSKSDEFEQILDALRKKPFGASISEIEKELTHPLSRRTLQRRLSTLVKDREITSKGELSGTRYIIRASEDTLRLSTKGKLLKSQVHQPIQKRVPVSYKPDFLYRYHPNKTFYLPKSTRQHLNMIGQQFNHDLEPGTYVKRILDRLLIDLSWNSSRLEGNTYSLLETERLIEFGAVAEGKNAFEAQMILNHKNAIEFMVESVDQLGFNQYVVLNIHALLSDNLLANPKSRGRLRQIPVGIGQTVYHPPEIPQLILECFQQILLTAGEILDPFEQAFFVMVQLPYLQPFEDINKRVSRLTANIPLIKNNLSPLSFIDVPKDDYISGLLAVYELNKIELLRDVFVWAYERSAQQYKLVRDTLGEPNLIRIRYRKELLDIIHVIVTENIRGKDIIQTIRNWVEKNIDPDHQQECISIAEAEVSSLHEGNISVYHIPPELFDKWSSK